MQFWYAYNVAYEITDLGKMFFKSIYVHLDYFASYF